MADPLLQRIRSLRRPQAPEQPGIAHLRAELQRKTKAVEDTLLSLDNLISPLDWQDAGFGGSGSWRWARPVDRTMDRTHAPLNYLNEQEWRWALAQARDLIQRNHLALGFRDHVSNFIGPVDIAFVLRGQSPGATASGPEDSDGTDTAPIHPLVRACTQVWDEWREWAEWGQGTHDREAECRRRLIVEGECTLRFFEGDARSGGLPHVRHIEPELIRTPPGHSTLDRHGWGVITADDDDEDELGLWVCHYQNVSEGKEIPASEYVRIKANVDRTVKRGWSDFNPVGEQLRKMMGLLDNMAHVARLQAAIAWWEEYPTATMQQVSNMILAGQDYSRTKLPPNAQGSDQSVTNYEAGTVVRTESGREVKPGPVSTPEGFAKVEQMVLRSIGFRWGCPSYFSGDSQDSFASVLVTGSPFVRITEARQEEVKGFARRVAVRVLEFAERSGRLPPGASQRVRPVATAKPVVIADEEKQARTFLSLYEKNCADPVEFIRKRGGDPKVVAANIAAWQKKFAPPQQAGGDAIGGDLPPSGPAPAPPGSAGGDGSSPNADLVGEGQVWEVAYSAKGKKEGDVWKGPSGRWFTLKDGHVVPAKNPSKAAAAKSSSKRAARALALGGPNLMHATPAGGGSGQNTNTTPGTSNSAPSAGAPGGSPPTSPPTNSQAKKPKLTKTDRSERSRIDKMFKKAPDPEQNPVGYLASVPDKEWEKLQQPAKKGSKNAATIVRLGEHLTGAIFGSHPEAANTGITDVPVKVQLADGEMDAAVDSKVAQVRSRDRVMVSYPTQEWIAKRKQARDQGKLYVTCVIHPGFPNQKTGKKHKPGQTPSHSQGRIVLQIGGGDVNFPKDGSAPSALPDGTRIDLGALPSRITDFVKDKSALDGMRRKVRSELQKHSKKGWEERVAKEQVAVHEHLGTHARPEELGGVVRGALKNKNPAAIAELRRILAEHDATMAAQNTGAIP